MIIDPERFPITVATLQRLAIVVFVYDRTGDLDLAVMPPSEAAAYYRGACSGGVGAQGTCAKYLWPPASWDDDIDESIGWADMCERVEVCLAGKPRESMPQYFHDRVMVQRKIARERGFAPVPYLKDCRPDYEATPQRAHDIAHKPIDLSIFKLVEAGLHTKYGRLKRHLAGVAFLSEPDDKEFLYLQMMGRGANIIRVSRDRLEADDYPMPGPLEPYLWPSTPKRTDAQIARMEDAMRAVTGNVTNGATSFTTANMLADHIRKVPNMKAETVEEDDGSTTLTCTEEETL